MNPHDAARLRLSGRQALPGQSGPASSMQRRPSERGRLPLPAPRTLLLALAVVGAVAAWRWADLGAEPQPDAAVMVQRALRFTDQADGSIRVSDADRGTTVETIAPGADAFLRSAVRGLVRERKRQGIGDAPPFELLARADGRLTLVDTGTGRRIDLESFGVTNAAAFARLLPPVQRSTTTP